MHAQGFSFSFSFLFFFPSSFLPSFFPSSLPPFLLLILPPLPPPPPPFLLLLSFFESAKQSEWSRITRPKIQCYNFGSGFIEVTCDCMITSIMFLHWYKSPLSGKSDIIEDSYIYKGKYFLNLFKVNIGIFWKFLKECAISPTDRHNSAQRNSTGISLSYSGLWFHSWNSHPLLLSIISLAQENWNALKSLLDRDFFKNWRIGQK
jgi:hypothetical protein